MAYVNLIIGYGNVLQGFADNDVVVTTDQAATNFPVSNVITDQRQQVWRTTNASANHYVQFDTGLGGFYADFAAIFDVNTIETAGGAVKMESSYDATFAAVDVRRIGSTTRNLITTTVASAYRKKLNKHITWSSGEAGQSGAVGSWPMSMSQYFRFTALGTPGSGHTYTQFGKMFLGNQYALERNYSFGITYTPVDLSEVSVTPNGAMGINRKMTKWRVTFQIPNLTLAQSNSLRTIQDAAGIHTPCVFMFDKTNDFERKVYLARFTTLSPFVQRVSNGWDHSFEIEEMT